MIPLRFLPIAILPIAVHLAPDGASAQGSAPTLEERKEAIRARETTPASIEQLDRKARSEAILQREGVPFIAHLPVIASESEARIRSTEAVARRAMALFVVAEAASDQLDRAGVDAAVAAFGLKDELTPAERVVLWGKPTEQQKVDASWRYEALCALLWAIGYEPTLPRPDTTCAPDFAHELLETEGAAAFVAQARLRPAGEILDAADLIYRYHWAVTDARINGKEAPAGLHPGVVMERHHALNWLIGYMGQAWDDVTTDT